MTDFTALVMTKDNFDAATDDPKQARSELADNVDVHNQVVGAMTPVAGYQVGDGLESDGGSPEALRVDLQTNPGLQRTPAGIALDIDALAEATPTTADYIGYGLAGSPDGRGKVTIANLFALAGTFQQSYASAEQTITSGGTLSLTHGLTLTNLYDAVVMVYLVCQNDADGWTAGEVLPIHAGCEALANRGIQISVTSTTFECTYGSEANVFDILIATTGTRNVITNSDWKLQIVAYAP